MELRYDTPLQLLVAVILSAQTTDVTVNEVTPVLFARYPTAHDLATAEPEEMQRIIYRTGFFRNKTKSVISMAQTLEREFGGQVPRTMAELLRLPGVARKTANVVMNAAFGTAEGVVVDTHVKRVAYRLGLTTETKNTDKIERDLMAVLPPEDWADAGTLLVLHGRYVCVAGKPFCSRCPIYDLCPRVGVTDSR